MVNIKKNVLTGILILTIVFSIGFLNSQETLYCAEKTTYGAWCQNVPQSECQTGINPATGQQYRCDRTSCTATSYCSTGTCVDQATGNCFSAPQTTCNPVEGGFFYNQPKDEVTQCRVGCCLLGDEASLVERVRCDVLGKDYNVKATFIPNIQDENTCLAMASPEAKGACVFEKEFGRDCRFTTNKECQETNGLFSENYLCTHPDLGTICGMTQRTICVPGKNNVYYVDSCGNIANIYDANKINDIAYWSYVPGIQGVEVNLGDGRGNINSKIYGSCNYIAGSTCGPGNAQYGNFICKDLGCPASDLTEGIRREHGEEWCSSPIKSFENAKPGELSYLLYCYNGEAQYEVCDHARNKLCLENENTGAANCISNKWHACFDPVIETTRECLDAGDCKIVTGSSLAYLRTQYGVEKTLRDHDTDRDIKAACVPKYTPAFKFWDPDGTLLDVPGERDTPLSICEFASVTCFVEYTKDIVLITDFNIEPSQECINTCKAAEGWSESKCYSVCKPVCLQSSFDDKKTLVAIDKDWAQSYQNLCVSLGDCGVSDNYLGLEGYNSWRDLFTGKKIDWRTLVNAGVKKAISR